MSEMTSPSTPVEILLVEDDPGDVMMTREALVESKLLHTLHVLDNGEEAVSFLRREEPYGDAPKAGPGAARPQPPPSRRA